uniref:CRAL-TRIO domain-containing protein n=3 Tax=Photinus pyralis TaxID=7054 RepID=A0A1Y1MR58_PHOPY
MYREITDELKQSAECKLNEVSSRIEDDIEHIRQWMAKQPHLSFEIDNQLILSFLRCSKFSLQQTKEKIDAHYTARTIMPEMFSNRDPFLPEIQHLLNAGVMLPLPNLDPGDGSRIICATYGRNLDSNLVNLYNVSKLVYMVLDILLMEDDNMIINGIKILVQAKGFPLGFLPNVTPVYMKKHWYGIEKGFPFRIQELCVAHLPAPFVFAYNVLKKFASGKMSQRMVLVSESKIPELCQKSPHYFPKEMGGNNGTVQELIVTWKKKVESYKEWYLQEETKKSYENLRIGKPKTSSGELGVEGSFRQLDID